MTKKETRKEKEDIVALASSDHELLTSCQEDFGIAYFFQVFFSSTHSAAFFSVTCGATFLRNP